ncbi:MAG: peptidase M61 [Bacteroidota bacterium]
MRKLFFILFILPLMSVNAQQVDYLVDIQNPRSHYARVSVTITKPNATSLEVKMPVWTPGSYMVREFERNVDRVTATNEKGDLTVVKKDKSTWTIANLKGSNIVTVHYDIYCFEAGVRTSFINNDHAFILPTSCLMYVEKMQQVKGTVKFSYPEAWHTLSTTLPKVADKTFSFNNYDELADSPIEIGTHKELSFTVKGVPHRVAVVGINNCPEEKFTKDLQKICETMYAIVGQHPCKEYLFIIHHVDEGGGGLEHANSCVVQMPRLNYTKPDRYTAFLGLCAHEYFHLWNVKRIRPSALGPFDYSKENYTNLLWVAEGITSYYDELALYRAGFWTREQYLDALTGGFTATENRIGSHVQCLHEASFDAWIKEYRPSENSINSNISYYTKGAVVAALLDIEIVKATNGAKHLDDLMAYLYTEYYEKQKRGFTDQEFYAAINTVAGKTIDMVEWTTKPNDKNTFEKWNEVLKGIGCSLENKPNEAILYTGINTELKGEKLVVKSTDAASPAVLAGLEAGDELIAIDYYRLKNNMEDLLKLSVNANSVSITYSRGGIMRSTSLTMTKSPKVNYKWIILEKDNLLLNKWLVKA